MCCPAQVAIKKVLQDKRFKNRELQIMKMVNHPNIVKLKQCFYSTTEKDETYLHLVLEYVPDTVRAGAGVWLAMLHGPYFAISRAVTLMQDTQVQAQHAAELWVHNHRRGLNMLC
jgi:hypothetical protein